MNETEIDRIAAAANALRPDWPLASLRTLLTRPQIVNRPRRDVAVALAWVACDSTTKTPARVLEAGPWWHAAATDGSASTPSHPKPTEACTTCGRRHSTTPPCCDEPSRRRSKATPEAIRAARAALRGDNHE